MPRSGNDPKLPVVSFRFGAGDERSPGYSYRLLQGRARSRLVWRDAGHSPQQNNNPSIWPGSCANRAYYSARLASPHEAETGKAEAEQRERRRLGNRAAVRVGIDDKIIN